MCLLFCSGSCCSCLWHVCVVNPGWLFLFTTQSETEAFLPRCCLFHHQLSDRCAVAMFFSGVRKWSLQSCINPLVSLVCKSNSNLPISAENGASLPFNAADYKAVLPKRRLLFYLEVSGIYLFQKYTSVGIFQFSILWLFAMITRLLLTYNIFVSVSAQGRSDRFRSSAAYAPARSEGFSATHSKWKRRNASDSSG